MGHGKGGKGGGGEEEYVGRVNCAICMDTDAVENTPWGVLLSCGHVFHLHCAQNCLNVKPECPTCRAQCSPSQVQRVFINNAIDPSAQKGGKPSKPSKSPSLKAGRESLKEPALECQIYPPIQPANGPPSTSPAAVSSQAPVSEYQSGWTGTSATSTGTSLHVSGDQGARHRTNTSTASTAQYPGQGGYYTNTGYDPVYGYQPQYQPHPGHPPYQTYATLAYDPYYPNQPRIVQVKRNRGGDAAEAAAGACLGCTALLALLAFCTIQ